MKPSFPIIAIILAALPLTARQPVLDSIPAAEQARQANTALAAFQALLDARPTRHTPVFGGKGPERESFMQGLQEQLAKGFADPQDEERAFSRLKELDDAYKEQVLKQTRQIDYQAFHARQEGVTVLPNGLQYDVYISPQEDENYKARRASRLLARIPGTQDWFELEGMPGSIDDLLYELPRAATWRFMVPARLFDAYIFKDLQKQEVAALETLAVRESLPEHILNEAKHAFDRKIPQLPSVGKEMPELAQQASRLAGRLCAIRLMHELDGRISASDMIRLMNEQWDAVMQEQDEEKLIEKLNALNRIQRRAEKLFEHGRHMRIADDMMALQKKRPGMKEIGNGVLCRVATAESGNMPISEANYVEKEELGARRTRRIRDRIISERDLPELLRTLMQDMPAGVSWEFVIPPEVLQDEWKKKHPDAATVADPESGPDLPLRYLIWHSKQAEGKQPAPPQPLPDVI